LITKEEVMGNFDSIIQNYFDRAATFPHGASTSVTITSNQASHGNLVSFAESSTQGTLKYEPAHEEPGPVFHPARFVSDSVKYFFSDRRHGCCEPDSPFVGTSPFDPRHTENLHVEIYLLSQLVGVNLSVPAWGGSIPVNGEVNCAFNVIYFFADFFGGQALFTLTLGELQEVIIPG